VKANNYYFVQLAMKNVTEASLSALKLLVTNFLDDGSIPVLPKDSIRYKRPYEKEKKLKKRIFFLTAIRISRIST